MRPGLALAILALALGASAKPYCTSDACVNGSLSYSGRSSDDLSGEDSDRQPWTSWQKLVVSHGALSAIGFIVLLPLGSLLARWARTFVPGFVWLTGHWVFNLLLAGPVIVVGFLLVHIAENKGGGDAPDSIHSTLGHILFAAYFAQVALGIIIHYIKRRPAKILGRPLQNYFHAVLGITIIALSFYQVRTGYKDEFEDYTGHAVPKSVNSAWLALVIIIPVLYVIGLALLPRQYRQESEKTY